MGLLRLNIQFRCHRSAARFSSTPADSLGAEFARVLFVAIHYLHFLKCSIQVHLRGQKYIVSHTLIVGLYELHKTMRLNCP